MMASPDNLLARKRRTRCRNSARLGTMEHDYYSYLQDERRTPYPDDDEALVARQAHLAGQGRFVAIFFGLVNRPKRAVARVEQGHPNEARS